MVGYLTERLPENRRVQDKPARFSKGTEPGINILEKRASRLANR
jgi:hypothetical protein